MDFVRINRGRTRVATCAILDLVNQGVLDKDELIRDLLNWMDEAEVRDYWDRNLRESFRLAD